jgi:hypothetical protein
MSADFGRYLRDVAAPKPLFVIGIARGGTTLLARILDGADGISVASDPYIPLYRLLRTAVLRAEGIEADPSAPLPDYYFSDEQIAAMDAVQGASLDAEVSAEELDSLQRAVSERLRHEAPELLPFIERIEGDTVRELFDSALAAVAVSSGADRYAGTKEVWTAEFAGPLARVYPDARFVLILRDPRAVLASLQGLAATDPTQAGHPLSYARHWRKAVAFADHFRRDPDIGPRLHVLRYEDLVLTSEDELQRLCEFLEIPYAEQMVTPQWEGNSSFGDELTGIDPAPLEHWRTQLDPGTLAMCELVCGPDMRMSGYEPTANEPAGDAALAHLIASDAWDVSWRSDLNEPERDFENELTRRSLLGTADPDRSELRRAFLFEQLHETLRAEESWPAPASTR